MTSNSVCRSEINAPRVLAPLKGYQLFGGIRVYLAVAPDSGR